MAWSTCSVGHDGAGERSQKLSLRSRANTHTTTIVIMNPPRMKKMPMSLRYGIALLQKQTAAHASHVVMM